MTSAVKQNTLQLDSDRRDEPRYPVMDVEAVLRNDDLDATTLVLDLSLNGALLQSPEPLKRGPGEAVAITVQTANERSFSASARIVHCTECRLGIEFLAFEPNDFDVLSELIGELRRNRVASLLSNPRP